MIKKKNRWRLPNLKSVHDFFGAPGFVALGSPEIRVLAQVPIPRERHRKNVSKKSWTLSMFFRCRVIFIFTGAAFFLSRSQEPQAMIEPEDWSDELVPFRFQNTSISRRRAVFKIPKNWHWKHVTAETKKALTQAIGNILLYTTSRSIQRMSPTLCMLYQYRLKWDQTLKMNCWDHFDLSGKGAFWFYKCIQDLQWEVPSNFGEGKGQQILLQRFDSCLKKKSCVSCVFSVTFPYRHFFFIVIHLFWQQG